MKWKIYLGIVVLVILGIAAAFLSGKLIKPEILNPSEVEVLQKKIEKTGNKYEAELIYSEEKYGDKIEIYVMIKYKIGEKEYSGMFLPEARKALDWIKNNTKEETIFLCLPEYRWMLKGYAERNTTVSAETIINAAGIAENKLPEEIRDATSALITNNTKEIINIMKKYGASYVFVFAPMNATEDYYREINRVFERAGLDPTKYIESLGIPNFVFTDLGSKTMIARFIADVNTEPFELVYSDEYVKIYQLKQ